MRAPNTNPNLDPTPEMIQLSLRKLLASELFARSVRHSRFLRYTVEETLAGRGSDLNQYVLGLEVFDRKDSFDPNSDSIVRVGAMRLRAKLKAYYETEGQEDSVHIEFPFGYMPVFRWRQEIPEERQSGWLRVARAFVASTMSLLLSVRAASSKLFSP